MQSDTRYQDLLGEVRAYLENSIAMAESAGIKRSRIAIDPGIGFAKSLQGNLELIRRLGEFLPMGFPVLVGASRKSFIGTVTGRGGGERLFGTAAVVAVSVVNGASIVRVHDVAAMRDVAVMARALAA
jgi:dihydropteroate synthase